jgi:proton-translocating NADH-quinone oxidoreductase chain N
MWLTDLMEIQFAATMLVLLADFGKKYYGQARAYVIGSIAIASLIISLAEFLSNWQQALGGTISVSPVLSVYASLYTVDKLGMLVIFTILVLGLAVAAYSSLKMSPRENAGPFFALILLLTTSTIGVVSAGDFLTLFLFWEVMSISAYGIVAFQRKDLSLEAAMKYLFLAGSGSLLYLFGVAMVYSAVGSIQFSFLPQLLQQSGQLGLFAIVMVVIGLGVEAAIFPMQTWLPDAYAAAPVPASALLAGAVTATAVFAILKLIQPLILTFGSSIPPAAQGLQLTLVCLAVLTMLVGNLGALGQTNVRRMLAFSSVAQVGYMLAALATFNVLGLVAIVFHIWNHGLVKSSYFMLTGTSGDSYEGTELEKMKGVGQQDKTLGVLYASSSLAMVGSPPFGMFWSELLIVQSILSVGTAFFYGLAVTVVLNVLLSVVYYFRVISTVAMSNPEGAAPKLSRRLMLPPLVLLLVSLLMGIIPSLILRTIT